MPEGWFGNHRSLQEQLLGLDVALAECPGKSVLDVGCAEGLIAMEFVKAGAKVHGFDNNLSFVQAATQLGLKVSHGDLNVGLPEWMAPRYDIVLALAVLHKAMDVPAATRTLAQATGSLMVIRLPHGSEGVIKAKHYRSVCNLKDEMPLMGFSLERMVEGPRREMVQYWRRR